MQEHAQAMLASLARRLSAADILGPADHAAFLALPMQPRPVAARTEIAGGTDPVGAHLILEGIAYRYEIMPDGVRRIVALYFPGDLCFSRPPLPTAPQGILEALCDGTVADLPTRTLQAAIDNHPAIERALWWLTSVELGIARQWLVLAGRLADRRIAHLICEILARIGAVGTVETDTLPNPFRQAVVADITAVSTVHVNRVLQALQGARLIALKRGIVTVRDRAGLAALADFDPAYLHLTGSNAPHRGGRAAGMMVSVVPMCRVGTGENATRHAAPRG